MVKQQVILSKVGVMATLFDFTLLFPGRDILLTDYLADLNVHISATC